MSFASDPGFVSRSRRITAASLRHWKVPTAIIDDAVLIVSELVTNAIEHGGRDTVLRIRLQGDDLCIEVADGKQTPAVLQTPTEDSESGRGLFLVALLTDQWGTSDGGATTWCTLRIPPGSTS
ncbi:ATP-binding protein [Streptomyces sp. HUAS MG91]|uniref:ATP-binding protein n=1 Tax=Streptomyces tabacisoli TaxID=3156398 RepID=A0AAU8J4Y3_9ACTN